MTSATGTPVSAPASFARIESRILFMRGHRVMIDADLAALYGVPTKALNQAVKRNAGRFPQDFMFQLTPEEKREVVTNCGHLASLKFSKALPLAFTEHGAIQAANVLNSVQAVDMGVYVVRAFVRLREMIVSNTELASRLNELESKVDLMSVRHDTLAHSTHAELAQLFEAIRHLMAPPQTARKQPMGFVTPEEKPARTKTKLSNNDNDKQ
jgi:hypothetical protein